MATAAVSDDEGANTTEELENPPASYESKMWKYFGFPVSYEGTRRVVDKTATVCRLCSTRVPYPPSRNTSNMGQHMSRHHKDLDMSDKKLTQPTISDSLKTKEKLPLNSTRARDITRAVGVLIATDM